MAFSSVLWFLFKDSYVDVNDTSFESWTFGMFLDTATSFPWIPALYTGVFSTVLCMWAEVCLPTYYYSLMALNKWLYFMNPSESICISWYRW